MSLVKDDDIVRDLLRRLIDLKSPEGRYFCWGYNFDWQCRGFFLPKFAPNIVCTTFAGNTLLDAYDKFKEGKYLDMALSAGNFILEGLNITKTDDGDCFSYTPLDRGCIHNANLLGAAFLSRLYSITQDKKLLEYVCRAARFTVYRQRADGSWPYGEDRTQRWIDNFHTGFNLCALRRIGLYAKTPEFEPCIERGFNFYREHFFGRDEAPKYYHDHLYPIDIHSAAQSIITFVTLKDLYKNNIRSANAVFNWTMSNMWNGQGFFYFQKHRLWTIRIPYMRWSQAWMLLALAMLKEDREAG